MLILTVVVVTLLFEGWTTHEVDSARAKRPCAGPIPRSADTGEPVLRFTGAGVETAAMPPRTAAVTFIGGPDPVWTPRLLDLLRASGAHATFFVYGKQATRHPELVRRIRDEGHEIGSYTYTGGDLGAASHARARMELGFTQMALAGVTGEHTRLLRLPHTTTADTLCGAEWPAAERAARQGYLIVAADRMSRQPAEGVVRQYSHTGLGFREARSLLRDPGVERFTTLSAGLGQSGFTTRAPLAAAEGRGPAACSGAGAGLLPGNDLGAGRGGRARSVEAGGARLVRAGPCPQARQTTARQPTAA
jgi:peptidoglycan/xylan/chitin deacetylase (PgdA/CDA1 family)